jgi:hypothetical protein
VEGVDGARLTFCTNETALQTDLSKLTIGCEVAFSAAAANGSTNHVTGLRLLPPGALSQHGSCGRGDFAGPRPAFGPSYLSWWCCWLVVVQSS